MDFKPLITLLAIVNPLAIVPFFIHYTQGFSREQRIKTIWISSFSAFAVIATSALAGPEDPRIFQYLAGELSGGRRHAAADQLAEHAQRAAR
jgi:small neutral amino acid transporter SnatA (MarC family)